MECASVASCSKARRRAQRPGPSASLVACARGTDALLVLVLPSCAALRALCLLFGILARLAFPAPGQQAAQQQPQPHTSALPQQLARAEDVTDSGLGFVELGASRDTYLLGEPFVLRLRFGLERELLRSGMVQLFQRPLDVPVQVFASALEDLEGAWVLDAEEAGAGASFALGEGVARATRAADLERGGRSYAVFEYERHLVASRPGALELAAPLLGFARATRFAEDFVLGSVPLDRKDLLLRGVGATLTILPLPEEGRPPEFTGAIGRYVIRASAEPRELAAEGSLVLTVHIVSEGPLGDLSTCPAPDLGELAAFHVRGSLVERERLRLTARYDLVPRGSGTLSVPPIRFVSFDVTPPAGYRAIETQPIVLAVSAKEPEQQVAAHAREPREENRWRPFLLVGAALAVLALGGWFGRRRRA